MTNGNDLGNPVVDVIALTEARDACLDGTAKETRLSAGLSLAEVARAVGVVGPTTVLRWENCERRPRGEPGVRYGELLRALRGR